MKKINITISGALGRMGKILIKRISKNKNLRLFSLTDLKSGKNINGIKTQKNNLRAFKKTDVIIDFSRPKASNILSKKIPSNYYIGINDDHHKKKVDYPSGTALMLANAVSKGKNKNLESIKGKFFLNKKGNLQKNKINFFITRKGNTIGKHSVLFNNKIENIELKHTAFSRDLFADGALNAAIWISKKNKGLFNMQDMFGLK